MDVFLEEVPQKTSQSFLARLAVAKPLRAASTEELIAEAVELHQHGFRHVAVRRQQVRMIGEHSIREILDDYGLTISCLGFAGGFTGALGWSFDMALSDVGRAIEMAEQLSASSLVIVPGNRGLHTYRHAERIVRDGLCRCAELVENSGTRLLVPTDTVLAGTQDCFQTKLCPLEWIGELQTDCIRPMIVVRGNSGAWRLPRGWRESLANGGRIRICHRCDSYLQNSQLLRGIINFLYRGESGAAEERLKI